MGDTNNHCDNILKLSKRIYYSLDWLPNREDWIQKLSAENVPQEDILLAWAAAQILAK